MNFQFPSAGWRTNFHPKKGEIATVLTVATVAVVTISSIVSSFFVTKNKQTTQTKASGCIPVLNVITAPQTVSLGGGFDCKVTVSSGAGAQTISCGLSVNGGWPQNICPSDTRFKGWSGNTATFGCTLPSNTATNADLKIVGFDFSSGCGPGNGVRIPLQIQNVNLPTATPAPKTPPPCDPGKLDINGNCNPVCCANHSQCTKSGEACVVSNGYCQLGFSCGFVPTSTPRPNATATRAPTTQPGQPTSTTVPGCVNTGVTCGFAGNQSKQCCSSTDECRTTGFTNMTCITKSTTAPTSTPTPTTGCAQTNQSCGFAGNQSKQCCISTDQCRSTGLTSMSCVTGSSAPTNTPTPTPTSGNGPIIIPPTKTPTPTPTPTPGSSQTSQTGEIKVLTSGTYNSPSDPTAKLILSVRDYRDPVKYSKEEVVIPRDTVSYTHTFTITKVERVYEVKARIITASGAEIPAKTLNCGTGSTDGNNCYINGLNVPSTVTVNFQIGTTILIPTSAPIEFMELKASCTLTNDLDTQTILTSKKAEIYVQDPESAASVIKYGEKVEVKKDFAYRNPQYLIQDAVLKLDMDEKPIIKGKSYKVICGVDLDGYQSFDGYATVVAGAEDAVVKLFASSSTTSPVPTPVGPEPTVKPLKTDIDLIIDQKCVDRNVTPYYFDGYVVTQLLDGDAETNLIHHKFENNIPQGYKIQESLTVFKTQDNLVSLGLVVGVKRNNVPQFIDILVLPYENDYSEIEKEEWVGEVRFDCSQIQNIQIAPNNFQPVSSTIKVGTTVIWTNIDGQATVTGGLNNVQNGTFSSGILNSNDSFIHRFDSAGSYPYYSLVNVQAGKIRTGEIIVQP